MFDPQAHFSVALRDLVGRDLRFAGILVPDVPGSDSAIGVMEQFLGQAEKYHQAYTSHSYWAGVLGTALTRIGRTQDFLSILDVGSGSGNSVIPLLARFPEARIVASDISPQLLSFLRDYVQQNGSADRLSLVCMDAGKDFYVPETFDLVVGAAILHHIYHPEEMIKAVLKAIKPGGFAIFFEPFEDGNAMLRLAYHQILSSPRAASLDPGARNLLLRMLEDYSARMDRPATDPIFTQLDDKWMFSRSYFFEIGEKLGISKVSVYPLQQPDRPFTQQTRTYLRLGANLPPESLADWAWEHIGMFDTLLSSRVKEDLPIEGCILMRK